MTEAFPHPHVLWTFAAASRMPFADCDSRIGLSAATNFTRSIGTCSSNSSSRAKEGVGVDIGGQTILIEHTDTHD